jgi:tetratricopeptide (TPR) repeat protein
VYFSIGKYQKSQTYLKEAINHLEREKIYPSFLNLSKAALLRAKVAANRVNTDNESVKLYASKPNFEILNGWTKRLIAEILLYTGDDHLFEAEEWITKSIEIDKKNGMQYQLGQDYATCAKILKRRGESDRAIAKFRIAIDILVKCGADGWVEKYQKELAEL